MKPGTLFSIIIVVLVSVHMPINAHSAPPRLTIVHTNDLHSHLLGFSPNGDYSPEVTGNDQTLGGWARIATVIKSEKRKKNHPVLVLDAGDFLMGSLFHMVSREEAFELGLMKKMGYDVTTLGNHEFDLKPDGLARIIRAAVQKKEMPDIVSSNLIFNDTSPKDDTLENLYQLGLIKPYTILEKNGLKLGIFGLVGKDAAGVAPFASPVKFSDPVAAARKMVDVLKEDNKVDVVICLSHSGLGSDESTSEDVLLADNVPGIDIIISGHTHTVLPTPIVRNNTIIVQAWEYGKQVGVLDVTVHPDGTRLEAYDTVMIDDNIKGDEQISREIELAVKTVNQRVLQPLDLSFDQVIVETDFDLNLDLGESTLGNLVTDATRWAVDQAEYNAEDPSSRVMVTIQSNGVIRDSILKGRNGRVRVSDLFRVVPLGIGWDGSLSYPLVSFYVTAAEIKKACEILTTVYPMKSDDYFLQFSGLKISYNFNRMVFDRVTGISIQDETGLYQPLDYSSENKRLYKVVSNIYNATFLKVIGSFTHNILTIVPKDKSGSPIQDFTTVRVDGDKSRPGIQEIKDWTALMGYVKTFQDKDGDGIPEIPEKYRQLEGRQTRQNSINPYALLKGGNYLTWMAFGVVFLATAFVSLIIYIPVRIIKKKTSQEKLSI